jgi:magnesium-transporting ATPase (P-type)
MARVSSAKTLTLKRPSANLLAFSNLFGVFLHMLCSGILQWLLFAMTPWAILSPNYSRPPNPDHVCVIHEATALHYYTSLSYVYYAVVLSVGPNARKWKRSIFTNYLYIAICAISTLCSVLGLLFGPSRLWFLFTSSTDQKIDDQLKLAVLLWTIFGTITCLIVENILIPAIRYCSKLRLQKYRTYTVFGAGNSQFGKKRLNAKPYHAIRAEFEANFGRNNVKRVKTSRSSLSKAV